MAERLEASLEAIKDLQWEVREGEARYRDLLDRQDTVIHRRDATGRLTFVNDAFCRTFGLERETALGQGFQPVPLNGSATGTLPMPEGEERRRYMVELMTSVGPRWFAWEDFAVLEATEARRLWH
jgi:PAS domain-containing protein